MKKSELIEAAIKSSGNGIEKKKATILFDSFFTVISKAVKKDDRCAIPGFGTFKKVKRKARKGRNPQTGDILKIKASKSVGFKPAPSLKSIM